MAKKQDPKFGPKTFSGEGRASFAHLDTPDASKFGQNKYKLDVIFADPAQLASIKTACTKLAELSFTTTENVAMPWKDGDKNAKYAGYEGSEYFTTKSKNQPIAVDCNNKPLAPADIYSGSYVRVKVTPLAYEMEKEVIMVVDGVRKEVKEVFKGISLNLIAVQKTKDGESFGPGGGGSAGFDDEYAVAGADTTVDDGGF